ncbi:hypothetical protein D9613_003020 [Agrocybe pediades]|uniref:ARM repeat-containing protein n=1 Tax=Agrocybe pediades TaxID=84607 RepID=A0A8H4VNV6_9AGAR|nr:hypothetical protein D9613_003020 [Agrocybe pediades]
MAQNAEGEVDLIPFERRLKDLSISIRDEGAEESWAAVESTSREIANHLRVRLDNHTILGKSELPQTLVQLLPQCLRDSHIAKDDRTAVLFEILRVGANLCMDHNDNRAALLEVGFPQSVLSLLEGYAEGIPSPPLGSPLLLSISHLKVVRTAIGVLLNASIGYDPVKFRLISLEAAHTIIKLSANIYPPTAWISQQPESLSEDFIEEWDVRSGISNWAWRTVSALKDIQDQDESLQIINPDVLPWITAPLQKYFSTPLPSTSILADTDPDLFETLVQTDFDFLEESCTIIESHALDVEEFRLELARSVCYPMPDEKASCLATILKFIEHGTYPALWKNPALEESEVQNKEKAFDICKAALIKAVVEVFAEKKNEEILWKDDVPEIPGGSLIDNFVRWIRSYVESAEEEGQAKTKASGRDDLAICAGLSLGNITRKEPFASALLSAPYSLAPVLSSPHFFSPSTDVKLKHGILGLLKHICQFSKLAPVIPSSLAEVKIIERIAASGIWDEKSDAMADIVQQSAIGVAKHLCNASLDHVFSFVLPNGQACPTGLSQILALIKRSDSVTIQSEGSRVLVNVVKSLWLNGRNLDPSDERQKKRDRCISLILTPEFANALTSLIARSNKYPILVNEGIVAISLLATHRLGGPLVLDALTTPANGAPLPIPDTLSPTLNSGSQSPASTSYRDGLPVPKHALDMLIFVLRNIENPVNFPMEVRVNACTFFTQLQASKNVTAASIVRIREAVLPVVQQVVEDSQGIAEEAKLAKAAKLLIEVWTRRPSSST